MPSKAPTRKIGSSKNVSRPSNELSQASADFNLSKQGSSEGNAIPNIKDIDIRSWSVPRRLALRKGEMVPIYVGEYIAIEISERLLHATSTKFDKLLQNGAVKLPAITEEGGVVHLVEHIKYISTTRKTPAKMSNKIDMFMSLSVCTAASVLGMEMYVNHVYKKCESVLREDPSSYKDLDANLLFDEEHARLFKIVVNDLAVRVREGSVPTPQAFRSYLAQYPRLEDAIKAVNDSFAEQQRKAAKDEERNALDVETRAIKNEAAQRTESRWVEKNAKRAALEKACMVKPRIPLGRLKKFSAEERAHWISTRGEIVPKGC
jgi:hypothetical protein